MRKFHLKLTTITTAILLLSACAGNKGGFDTESVELPATPSAQPQYSDEQSETRIEEAISALLAPALGFEIKIPKRTATNADPATVLPIDVIAISGDLSVIPHLEDLLASSSSYSKVIHSHDGKKNSRNRDFTYVRSGYVEDRSGINSLSRGVNGYVYYLGVNPSQEVPTGSATYNGYWDFTSDALKYTRSKAGTENGVRYINADYEYDYEYGYDSTWKYSSIYYGQTPPDEYLTYLADTNGSAGSSAYTSEFNVNFADKTLTGSLKQNTVNRASTSSKEIYSLKADIVGNRFRGTAILNKDNVSGIYTAIFVNDSDLLEGGFYGTGAAELAGKFLSPACEKYDSSACVQKSNEYGLVVVFAAKRDSVEGETFDTLFDAKRIKYAAGEKFTQSDNFGNATNLILGSTSITLLPTDSSSNYVHEIAEKDGVHAGVTVCCSNLNYLKFGTYVQKASTDTEGTTYLFMQGERSADVPTTGNYKYIGAWDGFVAYNDDSTNRIRAFNAGNSGADARSEFDVDFANKNLTGQLNNNGVTLFNVNATISGSGFTGTATGPSSGISLDPGSTMDSTRVMVGNAEVNGGFYGTNGVELGGTLHYSDEKNTAAAVFGARRQVESTQ